MTSPTRRLKGGRRGERAMVPDAEFTSYYGRPIVKASPWQVDIPAYLFLGGLAGGSSLLALGADLSGRPTMRRSARATALGAVTLSAVALIHDLGKPARFHHMLRVAKPTSPMSVGTWILTAYGPMAGLAALSELRQRGVARTVGRASGAVAAVLAPALASYTAVLLTDTATPSWHDGRREMPFVFVGSAAAAAAGMSLLTVPAGEAGPARRVAVGGAALELAMSRRMESTMGLSAEPMHQGAAGRYLAAARALTAGGALLAAGGRSRLTSIVAGAALLAGSWCTRFGIFHAGQASANDPRYTVVPQRERAAAR